MAFHEQTLYLCMYTVQKRSILLCFTLFGLAMASLAIPGIRPVSQYVHVPFDPGI